MLKLKVNVEEVKADIPASKLKEVLFKSMLKMEELAVDKAPVDIGTLRQNISLFPQLLSKKYVLVSKMPYSAPMEYGTRPFYAPIKPLKDWAKRVSGDESLGYAVRAKIAKQGITAQPFMRPAYYEVLNFWLPLYKKQVLSNDN